MNGQQNIRYDMSCIQNHVYDFYIHSYKNYLYYRYVSHN